MSCFAHFSVDENRDCGAVPFFGQIQAFSCAYPQIATGKKGNLTEF
jgi:hypothetical protein